MPRLALLCAMAAMAAAFAAGWLARPSGADRRDATPAADPASPRNGQDRRVDEAELARLATAVEELDARVHLLVERLELAGVPATEVSEGESCASAPGRGDPSATLRARYAAWSDEELFLAARRKTDDLDLLKAALARDLGAERRARLLLGLAQFYASLDGGEALERRALEEATGLAPVTTETGARALLELGHVHARDSQSRWRARESYELVLRNAEGAAQRMQAAYRLAWLCDLGDHEPAVALAAFRQFLSEWGEDWPRTAEVQWARHRVTELGRQP